MKWLWIYVALTALYFTYVVATDIHRVETRARGYENKRLKKIKDTKYVEFYNYPKGLKIYGKTITKGKTRLYGIVYK